jgi:hypothetical protein
MKLTQDDFAQKELGGIKYPAPLPFPAGFPTWLPENMKALLSVYLVNPWAESKGRGKEI